MKRSATSAGKRFLAKTGSVVMAGILAATLSVPVAFASDQYVAAEGQDLSTQVVTTDNAVIGAARMASMVSVEILGISNVEDSYSQFNDDAGRNNWNEPKYLAFGTSEYNTNPNPFLVNRMKGTTPSAVYLKNNSSSKGKSSALDPYDAESGAKAVWDMLPDVIVGVTDTNYDPSVIDYANNELYGPAAAKANNVTNYAPIGVDMKYSTMFDIIDSLYDIAEAGDKVVADSAGMKQLRYGNAVEIAKKFEQYWCGTQGYVLAKLQENGLDKKTFAIVGAYNNDSGTYRLITGSDKWGADTAKNNRYYDALKDVGYDLADTLGKNTVTKDELKQADLILIQGQPKNDLEGTILVSEILPTFTAEMQAKAFYYADGTKSPGAFTSTFANGADNVQHMGRTLACLYPEYVDQDDWVCYFFDELYHINSGALASFVDNTMDTVVNWDAPAGTDRTQWTTSDASTYKHDEVEKRLEYGVSYLASLGDSVPTALAFAKDDNGKAYLQPAAYNPSSSPAEYEVPVTPDNPDNPDNPATVSLKDAKVTVASCSYTGKALKPKVTVKVDGKAIDADAYTVKYSNNTNAGKKAVVTITAVEGKGYTDSIEKNFTIDKAKNPLKATAKKTNFKQSTKVQTTQITVKKNQGKVTYKSDKKKVTVSKKGKVSIAKNFKGKATITVKAAGNDNYKEGTAPIKITVKAK